MLEHRIAQLEERLLSARVITKKEISKDTVSVGSNVRLRDMAANKTFEYHIVGSAEANPAENKLSNESPVGKAIMGHKKGEVGRGRRTARRAQVQDPRDQGRLTRATLAGSFAPALPARSRVAPWRSSGSAPSSSPRRATVLARAFQDDPAWSWVLPSAEPARAGRCPGSSASASSRPTPRSGRRPGPCSAARAGCRPGRPRDARRPDAARARRDAAAAPRGDGAASSPTGARSRQPAPAAPMPGPHWYLAGIGVEPAEQRRGIGGGAARSRASRPPRATACPCALLTNTDANLSFYERTRVRGRARGRRRPTDGPHAWADGQAAPRRDCSRLARMTPKRFPDRDEIAAVRAEAGGARAGRGRAPRSAGSPAACWRGATWGSSSSSISSTARGRIQLLCPADRTGAVDVHLGDIVGVDRARRRSRAAASRR